MGLVTFTYTLTNGTTGDADQVQTSLDQLNNATIGSSAIGAGAITATQHGNCTATSGTATHHAARQIVLNDASGNFTTDNVEAALAELKGNIAVPTGATYGAAKFCGESATAVTVPANTFSNYLEIRISANLIAQGLGTCVAFMSVQRTGDATAYSVYGGSRNYKRELANYLVGGGENMITAGRSFLIYPSDGWVPGSSQVFTITTQVSDGSVNGPWMEIWGN